MDELPRSWLPGEMNFEAQVVLFGLAGLGGELKAMNEETESVLPAAANALEPWFIIDPIGLSG